MGKSLQEILAERSGKSAISKQATEARAQDYLDSRNAPPTLSDSLQAYKDRDAMAKLKRGEIIDPVTGLPLSEAAAAERDYTTTIEQRKRRKDLLNPKTKTLEEKATDFGGRAEKAFELEEKAQSRADLKIDAQLVEEGLGIGGGSSAKGKTKEFEKRKAELKRESSPAVKMHRGTGASLDDSIRIVNNIRRHPEKYGDNPNFDSIVNDLKRSESAVTGYKRLRDDRLIEADKRLTPEQRDNPYLLRQIAFGIDSLAISDIESQFGRALTEMVGDIDLLKGTQTKLGMVERPQEPSASPPRDEPKSDTQDGGLLSHREVGQPEGAYLSEPDGYAMVREIKRIAGVGRFKTIVRDLGESFGAVESLTRERAAGLEDVDAEIQSIYNELKLNFDPDEIVRMIEAVSVLSPFRSKMLAIDPTGPPIRTTGSTYKAQS